jgi:hypothetical protein
MERFENKSHRVLVMPSGKVVKPGGKFTKKDAAGLNLRALYRGGTIAQVTPKKRNG